MYILVLMLIVLVMSIFLVKRVDQRRWQRCQIERDLFFRNHPYELNAEQDCIVQVSMTKSAQTKLINEMMLKSVGQPIIKKAMIQREYVDENQPHKFMIKVMVKENMIGYLEKKYAESFCQNLKQTDFFIGRPIATLSEVTLYRNSAGESGCKVKLALPTEPLDIIDLIVEKQPEPA